MIELGIESVDWLISEQAFQVTSAMNNTKNEQFLVAESVETKCLENPLTTPGGHPEALRT